MLEYPETTLEQFKTAATRAVIDGPWAEVTITYRGLSLRDRNMARNWMYEQQDAEDMAMQVQMHRLNMDGARKHLARKYAWRDLRARLREVS